MGHCEDPIMVFSQWLQCVCPPTHKKVGNTCVEDKTLIDGANLACDLYDLANNDCITPEDVCLALNPPPPPISEQQLTQEQIDNCPNVKGVVGFRGSKYAKALFESGNGSRIIRVRIPGIDRKGNFDTHVVEGLKNGLLTVDIHDKYSKYTVMYTYVRTGSKNEFQVQIQFDAGDIAGIAELPEYKAERRD